MGGRGIGVLVAATLLAAGTSRAWGPIGHEVVARIAAERLTTAARARPGSTSCSAPA